MSKHILIATVMRPVGDTGVQTHFRAFLNYLSSQSIPASLVTPFDSPKWLHIPVFAVRLLIDKINGSASVWWYRHWHAVFLRQALRKALSDMGECVIYAQCPLSADAAMRSRKSNSQRVVMVVHFNISQADEWACKEKILEGGRLFHAIQKFEAVVLPSLDGLVFVSKFAQSEIGKRIPAIHNVPCRIIPNFLPDPGFGIVADKPVADLICIGTLEPRKNQAYAIEIVAAAKKLGQQLKLTIVGDGQDRTCLENLAKQLGVFDLIAFKGYVKQGAELMCKHRAYLHVSRMESFGIVLLEAMARGLPVFAPAVGGIPEVFDDGIEGRFLPLNNAAQAATLIIEWLNWEEQMQRAGLAARSRYLSVFGEKKVAANITEFLNVI